MNGINKHSPIVAVMGENLRNAREKAGLFRQKLVDRLNLNKNAPPSQEMTLERLKQWEYGINPIAIDWIPALCDELSFDVGYLFGEYKEHYRVSSDIAKETGLDEAAISSIKYIREFHPEYINVLSVLLQDGNLEYLLYLIHKRFLQTIDKPVKPIVEFENGQPHLKNAQEYTNSIKRREIEIKLDGATLYAQKRNLLDSLIYSAFTNFIETTSDEYRNINGGANNAKH